MRQWYTPTARQLTDIATKYSNVAFKSGHLSHSFNGLERICIRLVCIAGFDYRVVLLRLLSLFPVKYL